MINIVEFLPLYRDVNRITSAVALGEAVSYAGQKTITDFYRQFSDAKIFERMVLEIVTQKERAISDLLLSSIKSEISAYGSMYRMTRLCLDALNPETVCRKESQRFDRGIRCQMEIANNYSKELNQINGSLDAIGYREHTPQEEERLWQQHEYLTARYSEEKERLSSLYDQQREITTETSQYTENVFEMLYNLSLEFESIINKYLPTATSEPSLEIKEQTAPTEELVQVNKIDPDTIFHAKKFEKFLVLEQKLIANQYLSPELHWVSTHENGKADIKRLIIFLTGLVENEYFLPNRDPKIKTFFEARYRIAIGQNFEKSRRKPYIGEYKMVFYDYPF
ncbi:hypothetical protein [Bacteroides sp.]|uniref:hypothetical protein n=1 Tax=Bacteroides sp. TaxID=29523 RepID=UPI002FC61C38|nr:hypothetical protein [Muribaculaceae bacterium]